MSFASRPAGAGGSQRLALAVIATSALMAVLDGSIVTVAMPSIQSHLGFSSAGLSWVVNSYQLAFGGLLLLAGRLGDLLGRKPVFLAGIALFVAASAVAGAANSPAMLVTARFGQGIGSAASSAVSLGILVTLFTEPRERAKALGVFAFTGAAGASIGQVLGGVLTDALSWHWIFMINIPIGLLTLAAAGKAIPADRGAGLRSGVDALGALLVTGGLMLAIYTVVGTATAGWASARTLGLGALSALLIAGFFGRQATAASPLMPLRILRSHGVAGGNAVQMLMIAAMFAFQIVVALDMQKVLGYDATRTGLAMLPAAVAIGAVALTVSARLIARFGARTVLVAGLVMLIGALALLLRMPTHAHYVPDLLPTMVLIAGGGLAMPAAAGLGMSGAREQDAGVVSGLYNTTQQIGAAFGAAVLSTLAAGRTAHLLRAGHDPADALSSGYHLAFTIGIALLVAALLVAVFGLRGAGAGAPEAAADADTAEAPRQSTSGLDLAPTA
ncbi:MFS transporter [Catenulispora pinisilvae]|uniref:MFS transporter n=1 Tax=Catenulispora pinisilvae TaxID=2705253 RepID=UPI001891F74F|nr:MFS transporter [Catenulispora pinisilvae]